MWPIGWQTTNCLRARWGTDMDVRTLLAAVALNAALLALIALAFWLWRRRQPMTGARLRRAAEKAAQPTSEAPFGGDFVRMRAMLEALDGAAPDERTVAALLTGWAAEGRIDLRETPKKRLKSFGADRQASICFPGDEAHPFRPADAGAEGMLLSLLYGWADETATVQESELYNLAREYYGAVQGRLEQFQTQGKHSLRAAGAMFPEKKKRRLGFLDENRPVYTPRGVREAGRLLGYRKWLSAQEKLPPEAWRDAVLLDCAQGVDSETLGLARALSKALAGGAKAGQQAKHGQKHRDG